MTRAVRIEWVGPLCWMNLKKNRSMSGRTDKVRISGRLTLVLRSFAEVLPVMYPNAMCPTANELFSSFLLRGFGEV
jgi:uncharacterized protein (DUF2225 family)